MTTRCFVFLLISLLLVGCKTNSDSSERIVVIETEFGTMKARLFNTTPQHRDNFVSLIENEFYDGLLFHRVMQGFMIQGGDPNSRGAAPGAPLGSGGPGYTIPAEIASPHFKGILAAARTPNNVNPERASSGSQFFIVQGEPVTEQLLNAVAQSKGIQYSQAHIDKYLEVGGYPASLDMEYTAFGELISGHDVVDKIAAVSVDRLNRPVEDVKMTIRLEN